MEILYQNSFKKSFKKRFLHNKKLVKIISEKINQFSLNYKDPQLKTHSLTGSKKGFYSFSVTGDIRIIFYINQKREGILIDIGTHNQVY
ncbi:MAG: type II toxin-antitoxin system mRNA interferase toxin, RelE/StbE family [Patescibacteria group bacterium]